MSASDANPFSLTMISWMLASLASQWIGSNHYNSICNKDLCFLMQHCNRAVHSKGMLGFYIELLQNSWVTTRISLSLKQLHRTNSNSFVYVKVFETQGPGLNSLSLNARMFFCLPAVTYRRTEALFQLLDWSPLETILYQHLKVQDCNSAGNFTS